MFPKWDCDFLVFSGHKLFAPTGIGVLYIKEAHLNQLPLYQFGGGMVKDVSLDKEAEWADAPENREAGTPFIEGAIALAKAVQFLKKETSLKEIKEFESKLVHACMEELKEISGLKILSSKASLNIVSFVVEGLNCTDIATLLAEQKVYLRSGHHCCMPLMKKLNLNSGTVRASFSVYSHQKDVQALKQALVKAVGILRS